MQWLRSIPSLRIAVPFISGIILAFYYPQIDEKTAFTVALGLIGISLILFKIRDFKPSLPIRFFEVPLLFFTGIAIGYFLAVSRIEVHDHTHFSQFERPAVTGYFAVITDEPVIREKSVRTTIRINAVKYQGKWETAKGNVITYFRKDTNSIALQYGDLIVFNNHPADLSGPKNPNEFDYKRYLSHHYIYHRAYIGHNDFARVGSDPPNHIKAMAIALRSDMLDNYSNAGISGQNLAVISALTLGKKDDLTDELKTSFSSAGAMHVLAVSGLHVGIIFLIVNQLLFFLKKTTKQKLIKASLLISSIWAYALLTGFSPSVIRASTMFTFVILASTFRRTGNIYNILGISAISILLFEPFMVLEVGFQLSYLAVIGIVYLQPKLYNLITVKNLLLDKAWAITCVSFAAQIATAPLGLLYFHQFPVWFLFSNLIVIPVAFLIVFAAVLFQFSLFLAPLAALLAGILNALASFLNFSVRFIEKLPASLITGIDISVWETWLIYLLLAGFVFALTLKSKTWLFTALVCCVALVSSQVWEKALQLRQQRLTFFSVRNHLPILVTSGKTAWLIADTGLINNRAGMLFHIMHNVWHAGIDELIPIDSVPFRNESLAIDRNLLVAGSLKVAIVNNHNNEKAIGLFDPDIMVFDSRFHPDPVSMLDSGRPNIVISGTRTGRSLATKLKEWCDINQCAFYDLKNGAVELAMEDREETANR